MNLELFHLLDNETIDNSNLKGDFLKKHHQKGAQFNKPDQIIEFIFEENNSYHQIENAFHQYDITMRKGRLAANPPDPVNPAFFGSDAMDFINNAFA